MTFEQITKVSYQSTQKLLETLNDKELADMESQVKTQLDYLYVAYNDASRPKDCNALMGGIKKMETIYGMIWQLRSGVVV